MSKFSPNQKIWVLHNNELAEAICKFVNPEEVAYELDGQLFVCPVTQVWTSKESAKTQLASATMVAICREVSKETGNVIVYEVKDNPDNHDILCMSIRSRYNPELKYAVTMKNWFIAHAHELKDAAFFNSGANGRMILL